jgi:hypothetical protein
MLKLLAQDKPERVKSLHRAAVEFFEQQSDLASRAELLYHLMMLGADSKELESYWQSGYGPALQDALDEVPKPAAAWLATHLGLVLSDELAGVAERSDLERAVGKQALYALRNRQFDSMVDMLKVHYPFLPGSGLYGMLARVLTEMERYDEGLKIAQAGIRSMEEEANLGRFVELRMIEAVCFGRLGRTDEAERSLSLAESRARGVADRVCLTHVLTVRVLNDMAGDPQRLWAGGVNAKHVADLAQCLGELNETRMDRHRALLSWSAALVAPAFPGVSARIFRFIGEESLSRITSDPAAPRFEYESEAQLAYRTLDNSNFPDDARRPASDDGSDAFMTAAIVLHSQPLWSPQDVPGIDQYRDEWELQTTQMVLA